MKDLCTNCPHRKTCVSLCEKAEQWVNQDYVDARKAFYIPGLRKDKHGIKTRVPEDPKEIKAYALALAKEGKEIEDIAIHLECNEELIIEFLMEEIHDTERASRELTEMARDSSA